MTGGAFLAQMLAEDLAVNFAYAERLPHPERDGLFPVEYRLPAGVREWVRGKRVAIVDDAISAGSAVRGTIAQLEECGAEPVALGALIVLGSAASMFAANKSLPLEAVTTLPYNLWTPQECPLCASGSPLG
jgi:orotate phosphoribosyltransferase